MFFKLNISKFNTLRLEQSAAILSMAFLNAGPWNIFVI